MYKTIKLKKGIEYSNIRNLKPYFYLKATHLINDDNKLDKILFENEKATLDVPKTALSIYQLLAIPRPKQTAEIIYINSEGKEISLGIVSTNKLYENASKLLTKQRLSALFDPPFWDEFGLSMKEYNVGEFSAFGCTRYEAELIFLSWFDPSINENLFNSNYYSMNYNDPATALLTLDEVNRKKLFKECGGFFKLIFDFHELDSDKIIKQYNFGCFWEEHYNQLEGKELINVFNKLLFDEKNSSVNLKILNNILFGRGKKILIYLKKQNTTLSKKILAKINEVANSSYLPGGGQTSQHIVWHNYYLKKIKKELEVK